MTSRPFAVLARHLGLRLVLAALVVVVLSTVAVAETLNAIRTSSGREATTYTGPAALSSDAGARALFTLPNMAPVEVVERCVAVSYHGPAESGPVRLLARVATEGWPRSCG